MIGTTEARVLKQYAREIVNMRQAHRQSRFGLILGAGISKGFSLPSWRELLDAIAGDPKVQGGPVDQPSGSLTSRAEILYRHYSQRRRRDITGAAQAIERRIKGEWFEIIRSILYRALPARDDMDRAHPYLGEYLEIIPGSPLTVNYNFDSCVEMMLSARQKRDKTEGRPAVTIFDAFPPFPSNKGIIYHPNGYLPDNPLEGFSDELVFSEQEFGDQLLETVAGRYSSLANHLSQNICLFIGLSFADENLRYILRQTANNNPGHYHYAIHWLSDRESVNPDYMNALATYRFEVYNLVTLFLTDEEVAALGRLLTKEFSFVQDVARAAGTQLKWVFYLTGVPGTGKTSTCRHMRGLSTYDEWLEEPPVLLNKPFVELTKEEAKAVDEWVAYQFATKNQLLLKEKEGVFLIDRAPLDPLSFSEPQDLTDKAKWYREKLLLGDIKREICAGEVILLLCDSAESASRLSRRRGEETAAEYLGRLELMLKRIYPENETHVLDTRNMPLREQVKAIARVVHREAYKSADLTKRLAGIVSS